MPCRAQILSLRSESFKASEYVNEIRCAPDVFLFTVQCMNVSQTGVSILSMPLYVCLHRRMRYEARSFVNFIVSNTLGCDGSVYIFKAFTSKCGDLRRFGIDLRIFSTNVVYDKSLHLCGTAHIFWLNY